MVSVRPKPKLPEALASMPVFANLALQTTSTGPSKHYCPSCAKIAKGKIDLKFSELNDSSLKMPSLWVAELSEEEVSEEEVSEEKVSEEKVSDEEVSDEKSVKRSQ